MPDISSIGFDITIRHAALLEQLKSGQARTLLPFLRELDESLRLRLSTGELTAFSRARLTKLLAVVDENVRGIVDKFGANFTKELKAIATSESKFEAASLTEQVQNKLFEATVPAPRQVWAAATTNPLSVRGVAGGQLMPAFIKNWGDSQVASLVGRIRQGVFEGETNGQILRGIRGTVGGGFREGILGQTYRQSQAMIRTSVQHVSHQARLATLQANDDLVKGYKWVSTLDNRTSEICQNLSGEVFKLNEGPVPPAHINCRSTIVPVLDEKFDFLKEGRTQSSQFGPVDQSESYFSWIKQQPQSFQDQVLGPVKAKLLRDGGLTSGDFQKLVRADNYTPITLAQMQKLNPVAFEKAGIRITDSGRAVVSQAATAAPQAISKPPPRPKPKVVQERATASEFDEIKTAEPLNISGRSVSNAELTKALKELGTPEADKLIGILNNRQIGASFHQKSKGSYAGWSKIRKDPTLNKKWTTFVESLGDSPDGSRGILQAEPATRSTRGGMGFTSRARNYVIVFQERGFKGFANLEKEKIQKAFDEVIKRRESPFWSRYSGRLPDGRDRPWSFSREAGKDMLGFGPDHQMLLTWIHELGHQVDYRYRNKVGNYTVPKIRLTQYSDTNGKEWFAEHFVAWVVDRAALLRLDPAAVKIIDEAVEEALKVVPAHLRGL